MSASIDGVVLFCCVNRSVVFQSGSNIGTIRLGGGKDQFSAFDYGLGAHVCTYATVCDDKDVSAMSSTIVCAFPCSCSFFGPALEVGMMR